MTSECACLNCSGSSSCSERTKDAMQSDLTIIRIRLSIGGVKQRAEKLIVGRVTGSIVCVCRKNKGRGAVRFENNPNKIVDRGG
jgi:hypothetical protein